MQMDPRVKYLILEDLMNTLHIVSKPIVYLKVKNYFTNGLNLCETANDLLWIIPEFLYDSVVQVNLSSLSHNREYPLGFQQLFEESEEIRKEIQKIHLINLMSNI